MKKEQSELLDRYLAGEAPLHPERLTLPTDDELNEAEAAFDQMMAESQQDSATEQQQPVVKEKKSRIVRLWPWAAAASLLMMIGIGATLLKDEPSKPEDVVAISVCDGKGVETANTLDKLEITSDTISAPVAPTQEPATRPAPLRFRHVKNLIAASESIPDTLGNDLWKSERNVMLALQMLSECEETIRKGEQTTRNLVVEAEYRSTVKGPFGDAEPQPTIELVANENGDYEIVAANEQSIIEI